MKKFTGFLGLLLCLCLILTGCTGGGSGIDGGAGYLDADFDVPKNLLTEEGYCTELANLLNEDNFTVADDEYLAKIDNLGDRLEEMIRYNTDELTCTGTKYYVSNDGSDDNDGKSPENAWASLEKVNSYVFNEGDMVLFERGDTWHGYIHAKSGISYSAYGKGHKPKFLNSVDGKTYGEWVETETENVWVLDKKINVKDIGVVVFGYDNDAPYANKETSKSKLNRNLEFVFQGPYADDGGVENKIYLYCDQGNPAEVYDVIEISLANDNVEMEKNTHDVTLHNLEFIFGTNLFFITGGQNITVKYCVTGWAGGTSTGRGEARLGGGSGAWLVCKNIVYDHCYFYQQFDSGVTPQYDYEDKTPSIFEDFITTDCLFETCEYTLEYFNTQENTTENCFKNMYFGYNFCREGGEGFGTKASQSAYVKAWSHENTCFDCVIEYNVFDRALSLTHQINGYEQSSSGNTLSYDRIPELKGNIYIQLKNKKFAEINKVSYKYNEETYAELEKLGVETGARYIFTEKQSSSEE